MRVVAVKKGFDGATIRQEGEEFEFDGDVDLTEDSWMQPVDGKGSKKGPPKHGESIPTEMPGAHEDVKAKHKK